jgi:hypothetical protein
MTSEELEDVCGGGHNWEEGNGPIPMPVKMGSSLGGSALIAVFDLLMEEFLRREKTHGRLGVDLYWPIISRMQTKY